MIAARGSTRPIASARLAMSDVGAPLAALTPMVTRAQGSSHCAIGMYIVGIISARSER